MHREQSNGIAIVIPTLGRPSLNRMVQSLATQLTPADCLIVVADGSEAFDRCESLNDDGIVCRCDLFVCSYASVRSTYGNAQRNHGADLCHEDSEHRWVWFVDDDDTILPGAVEAIRSTMLSDPDSPTMFRMDHCGHLIPRAEMVAEGNVAGPILICPLAHDLPRFPVPCQNPLISDLEWIRAVDEWRPIRFADAVIYRCESHGRGKL